MSKLKKVIVSFVCVLLPALIFVLMFFSHFGIIYNSIMINDNLNNNIFNNTKCNDDTYKLYIIKNKMYYCFLNGIFNHGTYEMNNDSFKRVYWDGPSIEMLNFPVDYTYQGNLLYSQIVKGYIKKYNTDKHIFENYIKIPDYKDTMTFFVESNVLYLKNEKKMAYYKYNKGKLLRIADKKLCPNLSCKNDDLFFNNGVIYYNNKQTIYKYNTLTKKIEKKCTLKTFSNKKSHFKIEAAFGNIVYLINQSSKGNYLYYININSGLTERIMKLTYDYRINSFNNKVFIGDRGINSGLWIIKKNKAKQINKKDVYTLYVFDDEWIYYSDIDKQLYRISLDGSRKELVFGRFISL